MPGLKTTTLPGDTHPAVQTAVNEITSQAQAKTHDLFTVAPQAAQVAEGGVVIARISSKTYLYSKVSGVLYRVELT